MKSVIYRNTLVAASIVFALNAYAGSPPGALTLDDEGAWEGLGPQAIERVMDGEIIVAKARSNPGEKLYAAIAAFKVDTPIRETYRVLRETEKQKEYTKVLTECVLVERSADHEIVRFSLKFIAWNVTYQQIFHWNDENFRIRWKLDPSFKNGVNQFEGYWHLFYIDDDHTLVRYRNSLSIRDYFPNSVQQIIIRKELPEGLEEVRKRINSGGTYRNDR